MEQPIATAATALVTSTANAVARNAAASRRRILGRRRQVLQSSRQIPIQAVTPARAGIGIRARKPAPISKNAIKNTACKMLETLVVAPQRTLAKLRAGIPTLIGAP